MNERGMEGHFGLFQKRGKKLSKNFNFCRKGPNCKKLKKLTHQSQKFLKRVLKNKYTKKQGLYGKNILI